MDQKLAGILVVALALAGLLVANRMRDKGVQIRWSRRLPGITGGGAFLVAVLWLDVWTAVAIAASLTAMIGIFRLALGHHLRGVTIESRSQVWAEITYPAAGTLSLIVGWAVLEDRWVAFTPIAFMAWGDGACGLLRESLIWRRRTLGRLPAAATLGACLTSAAFYQPYWIAAAAAVTEAGTEYYSPRIPWMKDDNLSVVVLSLAVMASLRRTTA